MVEVKVMVTAMKVVTRTVVEVVVVARMRTHFSLAVCSLPTQNSQCRKSSVEGQATCWNNMLRKTRSNDSLVVCASGKRKKTQRCASLWFSAVLAPRDVISFRLFADGLGWGSDHFIVRWGGDCRKSRESIGELSVAGLIVESGGAKGNEFTQIPFWGETKLTEWLANASLRELVWTMTGWATCSGWKVCDVIVTGVEIFVSFIKWTVTSPKKGCRLTGVYCWPCTLPPYDPGHA